jgi:hypothetical protein
VSVWVQVVFDTVQYQKDLLQIMRDREGYIWLLIMPIVLTGFGFTILALGVWRIKLI